MPKRGEYDNSYPNQLEQIGTKLLEDYKGAKQHHDVKCLTCELEWNATPVFIKQTNRLHGTNGCPACNQTREFARFGIGRLDNIITVEDRGFDIISDWDGSRHDKHTQPINVTVKNHKCGHTFTSSAINLLSNKVNCPICNNKRKREMLQQFNIDRQIEYQKTASEWNIYRHKVYALTRQTYKNYSSTINPHNLFRGKAGVENAHHLDHIVPVRYCFNNDIPEEICAHQDNLQMLHWHDNVGSRDKIKQNIPIPKILQEYITNA